MLGWNKEQASEIAEKEEIVMTDEHWNVVYSLRKYYLHHGPAANGRELGDMLDREYADHGGRKYLRRLFPGGPVTQGMRIAGLQVPPYSEDEGFGTSR
jgi:tRNA 2-thiouridine synthesizing protein E